jgi:hypothetical protein
LILAVEPFEARLNASASGGDRRSKIPRSGNLKSGRKEVMPSGMAVAEAFKFQSDWNLLIDASARRHGPS